MGFFFLCVYLIFLFIRPQDWYMLSLVSLRPILLTLVLVILATIIDLILGRLQIPSYKQPWWLIMTGLFIGVVLSHAGNFYIGGVTFAFNDFGKTYLTVIVIWLNLNSVKRIEIFSIFLMLVATFIAVHCILVLETGSGFGSGGKRRVGLCGRQVFRGRRADGTCPSIARRLQNGFQYVRH